MIKSIGLLGPPSSGKTTFLAALYIAITRSARDLAIFGVNDESTDFMIDSTSALINDRRFPDGATHASLYSWAINMSAKVQVSGRRRFGRAKTVTTVVSSQLNIGLCEAPGGYFGSQLATPQERLNLGSGSPADAEPSPASIQDDMIDYLARCDGLLLLIAPDREQKFGEAYEYFMGPLLRIALRMPPGARLPHHVAVCITKFDHPDVYGHARLNGYRTYDENDPYLFPRVHDDDAEDFFREFYSGSERSDADLLCGALTQYFRPDRIRYFVTSAVGFYRQGSMFRDNEDQNTVEQSDGSIKIRGQIHPINVLEPVLWLGQSIASAR